MCFFCRGFNKNKKGTVEFQTEIYWIKMSNHDIREIQAKKNCCVPYSHQISPPLNFRPPGGLKLKGANWEPKFGEGRKLKGVNWSPKFEKFEKLCWINSAKITYFMVSILNLISSLKLSFRSIRGAKNNRSIRGAKINGSNFDSRGAKIKGSEI